MAVVVSDLGDQYDTGTDASSDFTFGSFGAEAADRVLIACLMTRDGASNYTLSSGTVGGVSPTITQISPQSMVSNAVIMSAAVPTGTSGTVNGTWSEGITSDQTCTLLGVTGLSSAVPYDTDVVENTSSGTTISATIDCPAGGLIVACVFINAFGFTSTWTLANEVYDGTGPDSAGSASVAYEVFATAQTGLAVTVTHASTAVDRTLCVASFSPPAGYSLVQSGGSFTLTGGTNTLTAQRKLVTSGGSFALTGGDTTFRKGFSMVASGGSYSLTGGDATFPLTRKLAMTGGSFALSGGDTGLLAGRKIVASGALFSLTGDDAAFTAQRILSAAGGSFALTGGDAGLRKGFTLSMLGGSFDLTGGDVDFIYVPTPSASPLGGHFGGAIVPRKRKWKKVDSLEALDRAIRETMQPDLIVLKDGTVIPVNAIELDDEEILLLL